MRESVSAGGADSSSSKRRGGESGLPHTDDEGLRITPRSEGKRRGVTPPVNTGVGKPEFGWAPNVSLLLLDRRRRAAGDSATFDVWGLKYKG